MASLAQVIGQIVDPSREPLPKPGLNTPRFTTEGQYAQAFSQNRQFAKPPPYKTTLHPLQEAQFRQWVAKHGILFDPNAHTADYDMRGYWLASGGKVPTKQERGGPGYPDTFKTPYDTTFSAESRYATPSNPFRWDARGQLVDSRTGQVVFRG